MPLAVMEETENCVPDATHNQHRTKRKPVNQQAGQVGEANTHDDCRKRDETTSLLTDLPGDEVEVKLDL